MLDYTQISTQFIFVLTDMKEEGVEDNGQIFKILYLRNKNLSHVYNSRIQAKKKKFNPRNHARENANHKRKSQKIKRK